ncbi:hypothetical protein DV872_26260 [Oceanispirochaeta sp. M1]|nr:hypothetical protein DV872_26260 [Oceanispirochaeta sp. M1]
MERASLSLAEKLSHFSQENHISSLSPDTSLFSCFQGLVAGFNQLQAQLHGGEAFYLQQKLHYFIGMNWPQNGDEKTSVYASDFPFGLDTS